MNYDILLASQSPRRRELIGRLKRKVVAISTDADETLPEGIAAEEAPELLAARKAGAAKNAAEAADRVIVAADTVVILGGEILGKPKDADDAKRMLRMLSGATHTVVTGVCIIAPDGQSLSFREETQVSFFPLTDADIDAYIATGEPMDKAGAYGIQGDGCMLVDRISGDYYNVVGLPVARLGRMLRMMGV